MGKVLLVAISGISFCTMPIQTQFSMVAKILGRYKVEALQGGMKRPEPTSESMVPAQKTSTEPVGENKELWIDRYLSVSYPLQCIRVTSPYGYRKDPFTGERKFHRDIGLHARGEQVLIMMEGVVVKVGQDKTSGKYMTLRHESCTVSYCHLSRVLVAKGTVVRPRDAVGITGSTGQSTGGHSHATYELNGKNINPSVLFDYIKPMQQECVSVLAGLLQGC